MSAQAINPRPGRFTVELPEMERRRAVRFYEKNPIVSGLTDVDAQMMLARSVVINVRRRRNVWSPGDSAEMVYFVRSGVVRESRTTDNGRELILQFLPKNSLIGFESVLLGERRDTVAAAHEDLVLYGIPRDEFLALLAGNPDFSLRVSRELAARRRRLDTRLTGLVYKSAPARLAAVFLELARDFGVRDSRGVILNLKLTHRELGALVGVTRETASFVILDMRKAGIIENERKQVVLRGLDELEELAESMDGTIASVATD